MSDSSNYYRCKKMLFEMCKLSEARKIKSVRYNWRPIKKPWWWIFTFRSYHWKDYGAFDVFYPEDKGYETASYTVGVIWQRDK